MLLAVVLFEVAVLRLKNFASPPFSLPHIVHCKHLRVFVASEEVAFLLVGLSVTKAFPYRLVSWKLHVGMEVVVVLMHGLKTFSMWITIPTAASKVKSRDKLTVQKFGTEHEVMKSNRGTMPTKPETAITPNRW